MHGENIEKMIDLNNYTYINPVTLEAEFLDITIEESTSILREVPADPLRERTPIVKSLLSDHPFFSKVWSK